MRDAEANIVRGPDTVHVDLLIAGAGPAGMAAAIFARLKGLDILLVEKSNQVGGTAATSAGTLWIPENTQGREAGEKDSIAAAASYLDDLITHHTPRTDAQRAAYFKTGVEAIDLLQARTEVKFLPCGTHPDYHAKPGAAVSGRAIIPATFDGRKLGRDFENLRAPMQEMMIFGGMMVGKLDIPRLVGRYRSVSNFVYSGLLFGRYLLDRLRFSRGTRLTMGNALVGRMFRSLLDLGVRPQFRTELVDLTMEGGRIVGARVSGPDGNKQVIARAGVILATGGFAHNAAYRNRLMPDPTPPISLACETNEGDGVRLAESLGARVNGTENGSGGFWTPVSRVKRRDGTVGAFPHLSLDRAKPGIIAVKKDGKRFCNEADSYHDFVEAMYRRDGNTDCMPVWLICDRQFIRKYGVGLVYPGTRVLSKYERSGYVKTASSPEELANRIGVDPETLRATISRYNEQARRGVDEDFHRGHSELNRFNGDPEVRPNPCVAPIDASSLCAIEVLPAEIACSAGLSTDSDARVVDNDETGMPGLFACGNDMASIMGDSYPGPGTTLGPAIVFAYRAVERAAQDLSRPQDRTVPNTEVRKSA